MPFFKSVLPMYELRFYDADWNEQEDFAATFMSLRDALDCIREVNRAHCAFLDSGETHPPSDSFASIPFVSIQVQYEQVEIKEGRSRRVIPARRSSSAPKRPSGEGTLSDPE